MITCVSRGRRNPAGLLLLFWITLAALWFSLPVSAAMDLSKAETLSGGTFVQKENGSWWYRLSDGSYCKNGVYRIRGKYYLFSAQGYRYYGWQTVEGDRYYFGTRSEGYLYRNHWVCSPEKDFYYMGEDGLPVTGPRTINGKEYFFDSKTGVNRFGWQKVKGKQYFFGYYGDSAKRFNTLVHTKKAYYFVDSRGQAVKGWVRFQGDRYYFGAGGKALTGRQTINGKFYTFDSTGKVIAQGADLAVSAECAILTDMTTGEVLYEKQADLQHANASTTKILTALLALEKSGLKEKVKVSAKAAAIEPTKMYLHAGETILMKDLLYGLMLPSGNDAAIAIAEHVSGSTSKFVTLMNRKAKSLGCTNTRFGSVNGLDNVDGVYFTHHTTARDLALITRAALKRKTFRKVFGAQSYTCRSLSGYTYSLRSTNALWGTVPGLVGGKTGYTNKAGYCFVGAVKGADGHTYISVVLGAPTTKQRWADSSTLLQYAYGKAAGKAANEASDKAA